MAGWGEGFAEGLGAGTSAAGKWMDAYNTAHNKYEVQQSALKAQGDDTTEVGEDFLKNQFGLDSDAAKTMLDSIRSDPTKARTLLNVTNAATGGAADSNKDALGAPVPGVQSAAVNMGSPTGTPLPPPGAVQPPMGQAAPPPAAIGGVPPAVAAQAPGITLPGGKEVPVPGAPGTPPPAAPARFNLDAIPAPYRDAFAKAMQQYPNVPPEQIAALAEQESSWNPSAVNKSSGASGLLQYMKDTAARANIDPFDPNASITQAFKDANTRIGKGYSLDDVRAAHFGGDDRTLWKEKTKKYVAETAERVRKYGTSQNLGTAPPDVQAQAVQTPEGRQDMADDLTQMQQLSERMRIPKNAKFSVTPDGRVQMSTPKSDADQYLAVAKTYLLQGNAGAAKQAMDMHFITKSNEAQDYIKDVMQDDSMNTDQKIQALAHGTGIRIYKAKDGGYVSPDLSGAAGEGGKYRRLSLGDISQYASLASTPEGMKYLYGHQLEMRKQSVNEREAALKEKQEGSATTPGSQARLREAQANYYDQRPDLELAKLQAKAAAADKNAPSTKVVTPGQERDTEVIDDNGRPTTQRTVSLGDQPWFTGGGNGGDLIRKEVAARTSKIYDGLKDSPYVNGGADEQVEFRPIGISYNPKTDLVSNNVGSQAGNVMVVTTATNPATGQREPFVMETANGKPTRVFASELRNRKDSKGLYSYHTADDALNAIRKTQKGGAVTNAIKAGPSMTQREIADRRREALPAAAAIYGGGYGGG